MVTNADLIFKDVILKGLNQLDFDYEFLSIHTKDDSNVITYIYQVTIFSNRINLFITDKYCKIHFDRENVFSIVTVPLRDFSLENSVFDVLDYLLTLKESFSK